MWRLFIVLSFRVHTYAGYSRLFFHPFIRFAEGIR
jgi:hypothetical protein